MDFPQYRRVDQLNFILEVVETFFPNLAKHFVLPHKSIKNQPILAIRIRAGVRKRRRRVLIVGGMHPRELMNPDAIVELALDLVQSYRDGRDLSYGKRKWSAFEIKTMLEALEVWLLPCANPDGRDVVLTRDDLWRKNVRDDVEITCPVNKHEGVDLNRNLDIVWGVITGATSCTPCEDTYVGKSAFSEPESRNIKYLCDTRRIDVFLDVHSYSELVMYPWGHAFTQTDNPNQRFTNLNTVKCQPLAHTYREYMSRRDQLRFQQVAQRIAKDIHVARERNYRTGTTYETVYPPQFGGTGATGTSSEYVYSRHIADPKLHKTYAFAFETGPFVGNEVSEDNLRRSFHPADPTGIKLDAKAGMVSLLQQSVCMIEAIGAPLPAAPAQSMRAVRDQHLSTTTAGLEWIALFERVQFPLLAALVKEESFLREAMDLLVEAQRLLNNENAIINKRLAHRGVKLLDSLTEHVSASLAIRRDLATARKELANMGGKRVRTVLAELLRSRRKRSASKG